MVAASLAHEITLDEVNSRFMHVSAPLVFGDVVHDNSAAIPVLIKPPHMPSSVANAARAATPLAA